MYTLLNFVIVDSGAFWGFVRGMGYQILPLAPKSLVSVLLETLFSLPN